MKPLNPGVKLTYDDFVLFPDDGKRHELIDGEHYVTPSPNIRHQQISADLLALIFDIGGRHVHEFIVCASVAPHVPDGDGQRRGAGCRVVCPDTGRWRFELADSDTGSRG